MSLNLDEEAGKLSHYTSNTRSHPEKHVARNVSSIQSMLCFSLCKPLVICSHPRPSRHRWMKQDEAPSLRCKRQISSLALARLLRQDQAFRWEKL